MSEHNPKYQKLKAPRALRHTALRHIGRSAVLEEPFMPRLMRFTIITISLFLGVFVAWASFTDVSEVTRAEGDVVPNGYVQVVQHLEGGIVSDILVSEGEMVTSGDVLLRLDGAGAREDLARYEAQMRGLKMEAERMRAYLDNRVPDFERHHTSDGNTASLADQHRYYESMVEARQKEAEIIRSQIVQKKEIVRSLESKRGTLASNLKISRESLSALKTLLDKGLANRFRYLSKQEEVNLLRGQLAETDTEIARAQEGIAEYEQRLASLEAGYDDQAAQELNRVENEMAQLDEVLSKLRKRVERLEVRAPTQGLVKGLEVHTIGGVVAAGQKILEIVPMDEQMIVEAKISTSDVGHLRIGQPVQVKVHSYDFVRYGMVDGTLEAISPTTFIDKMNKTYYRARVVLNQPYVGHDASTNYILPGMTVEADIITGTKTVLEYLLKPIHIAARSAMHER